MNLPLNNLVKVDRKGKTFLPVGYYAGINGDKYFDSSYLN